MNSVLSVLRAMAEPTRLRLLALCAESELTVTELTEILGQSQPRVSRHLKVLCDAGVLDRFREGSWMFFRLARDGEGAEVGQFLVGRLPKDDAELALDHRRLEEVRRARAEAAAAYFRDHAGGWDDIRDVSVAGGEVEAALLDLFANRTVNDLLDVGTGTGRMLEIFADRVGHAIGIDLSRAMLAVARANLEGAGRRNCEVRHGNMYKLPLASESFDAVVFHQVLHFADRPGAALAEAARVLRRGGRLAIADLAPHDLESLREQHAHRRLGFTDDEVSAWCRAAGLAPAQPLHLPGEPLTVTLWSAVKYGAPARREDHP